MRISHLAAVSVLLAVSAHGQFAPQGATNDPTNLSSATKTTANDIYKIVDHYYYDCLKKKWVWVSREWLKRGTTAFSSDEYTPVAPPKPEYAAPAIKELSGGPPSGADISAGDPSRAYNPTTGQNFAKEKDGSWIDVKTGKTAVAPKLCPPCPEPSTTPQPPPPKTPKGAENTICPEKKRTAMVQPRNSFDKRILDLHNSERAGVGAPPLQWNPVLAEHASQYAQQLALTGQLVHAPRERRGAERENLLRAPAGWSADDMMRLWTDEKSDFVAGVFPNIAGDGNLPAVLHYSQMIWSTTTDLGCGLASRGGFQWLVCRYSPGGNKDGKPVIVPGLQIAERPCPDEAVVRTERGA